MNEKEVKEGAARRRAVCSVTGGPCKCGGGRCRNLLDWAPEESVRWTKVANIRLDMARQALLEAEGSAGGVSRRYPLPEVRDWARRIRQIQYEIESVLS